MWFFYMHVTNTAYVFYCVKATSWKKKRRNVIDTVGKSNTCGSISKGFIHDILLKIGKSGLLDFYQVLKRTSWL